MAFCQQSTYKRLRKNQLQRVISREHSKPRIARAIIPELLSLAVKTGDLSRKQVRVHQKATDEAVHLFEGRHLLFVFHARNLDSRSLMFPVVAGNVAFRV